jgi:hypothetical protein
MSLIPSESYSFPDHFTRTVTPSRRPKEERLQAAAVEKPRKRPAIVALPDPPPVEPEIISEEPAAETPPPVVEPVRSKAPPPNPALRRATAPPPRIPETPMRRIPLPPTLKPKVRWNNRAAPMDPPPVRNNGNGGGTIRGVPEMPPAQNVIPMKTAKVTRPLGPSPPPAQIMHEQVQVPSKPVPVATETRPFQSLPRKPRPAVVPNPQADFFEMFAEEGQTTAMNHRRKMKFRRFIVCEAAVFAVLLPLVIVGLTLNVTAPALRWMMNIFTIAAAVTAAVIPIVFYAFTPTLPELER